ncbi:MAG: PhzF family phenazine biosynthesis isomerase [Bacteroidales bacterium]|nr:PhzF family phenazine biosynthesis isomerase [Bacteroidales bacterium]
MQNEKLIFQVDAFTTEPFKGNPAGVCFPGKEMPLEWMQNIAAEMNLSETSFIWKESDIWNIRYYSPLSEIPLCGHATLSSAHIMFSTGMAGKNETIIFSSLAGMLEVRLADEWITMNFPSYGLVQADIPEDLSRYIGITPKEFHRTAHGWTFVLLESEEEVGNLNPDFASLKHSPYGDLIVTAPSSDPRFDFCVRCFAPALGINEDPVTGSAHCALVPFWNNKTGKKEFTSHQVSARGGILKVSLNGDRVEIAGQAVTILKGELAV